MVKNTNKQTKTNSCVCQKFTVKKKKKKLAIGYFRFYKLK